MLDMKIGNAERRFNLEVGVQGVWRLIIGRLGKAT